MARGTLTLPNDERSPRQGEQGLSLAGDCSSFEGVSVPRAIEALGSLVPSERFEARCRRRARGRCASAKTAPRSSDTPVPGPPGTAARTPRSRPQRSAGAQAVEGLDGPRRASLPPPGGRRDGLDRGRARRRLRTFAGVGDVLARVPESGPHALAVYRSQAGPRQAAVQADCRCRGAGETAPCPARLADTPAYTAARASARAKAHPLRQERCPRKSVMNLNFGTP